MLFLLAAPPKTTASPLCSLPPFPNPQGKQNRPAKPNDKPQPQSQNTRQRRQSNPTPPCCLYPFKCYSPQDAPKNLLHDVVARPRAYLGRVDDTVRDLDRVHHLVRVPIGTRLLYLLPLPLALFSGRGESPHHPLVGPFVGPFLAPLARCLENSFVDPPPGPLADRAPRDTHNPV